MARPRRSRKVRRVPVGSLVRIEWLDIQWQGGAWVTKDEVEALKPCHVETVGWVVRWDPAGFLVVAGSNPGGGAWGDVNAIPEGVLRSLVVLEGP